MSFHILHILEHKSYLFKKRGRLYLQRENVSKSLPLENIKAVIVAAKGVTFSASLLASLLEHDAIILHCDAKFRPIGMSSALDRTLNQKLLLGQVQMRTGTTQQLWQAILKRKIQHQWVVLEACGIEPNPLLSFTFEKKPNEAHAARAYFRNYFKHLQFHHENRANKHQGILNAVLNYGYAVLSSLVHRASLVHGLLPQLGVFHRPRFHSWPLVYDLMEPLRPIVDALVLVFLKDQLSHSEINTKDLSSDEHKIVLIKNFARFIGCNLRTFRLHHKKYSLKLLDAIDFYIRSFANACELQDSNQLWIPDFTVQQIEKIPLL